ncbi:late secretory pathway protein AVL9 homolog [Cimex lectularius]|uniref:UDENN domain-containing protein n=1 Tax=Cimex lectularius TaxID=79782 RepID=A0A8I6RB88_CIMLE|nr:late secretory pathway protein AVL9 homolog [Cimex lectularius]XP_014241991.1 late secretory pathway protein AVL9 homolog [Cimex lectularius]
MGEDTEKDGPVLHVAVIGFHHKKGCQVEFSYPPLVPGGDVTCTECPPGWKYLPTLALPDGSHNYEKDTVFFHLPSLDCPNKTVFGVSCFRQIPVEKIKNRTSDITRGTVQKAVCVLSKIPLYGHIQVKMELITHAYFEEGDFTKVSLLEDTYRNLNDCLNQIFDLHSAPQLFVGLSARDLILTLRHKVLLLYKLVLLEKKVLFFQSPVQPLCTTILTLLSLHPNLVEDGLFQSACFKPSRPMSPVPRFEEKTQKSADFSEEADVKEETELRHDKEMSDNQEINEMLKADPNRNGMKMRQEINGNQLAARIDSNAEIIKDDQKHLSNPTVIDRVEINGHLECEEGDGDKKSDSPKRLNEGENIIGSISRDPSSMDLLGNAGIQNSLLMIAQIDANSCGLPLQIFNNGYLCLPYLSLPYMDVLTDPNIRGYLLGATNVLFKQKKNLADVVIELENGIIECPEQDLKRALTLSTEDLRFSEFLVRHVSATCTKYDVYADGVGWEGSEDWIRAQFLAYTLCLLRTSLLQEGCKEIDQFNKSYVTALQESQSYKEWKSDPRSQNILEINPGHPFAGQVSVVKDMKLKIEHTMQTTESGRKLNQAMVTTGRAVATTGKAVGGAFIQARGALSSWWSNLTAQQVLETNNIEKAIEADQVNDGMKDDKDIEEGIELVEGNMEPTD